MHQLLTSMLTSMADKSWHRVQKSSVIYIVSHQSTADVYNQITTTCPQAIAHLYRLKSCVNICPVCPPETSAARPAVAIALNQLIMCRHLACTTKTCTIGSKFYMYTMYAMQAFVTTAALLCAFCESGFPHLGFGFPIGNAEFN